MKSALTNIIVATIGAVAAVTGAYFTASAAASTKVEEVSGRVDVVTEREANHYAELGKSLTRIESKLDAALK